MAKRQKTGPVQPMPDGMYKTILEQLHEGVIIAALDNSFRQMNQAAATIYGYDKPEQFERHLSNLKNVFELRTYPGRRLMAERNWPIRRLQRSSRTVHCLVYVKRLDTGTERILEYTGKRINSGQGADTNTPGFAVLTLHDVTERKLAEEKLRESEEDFRILANNISQLAWTADKTGQVRWYNNRWYEYTGTDLKSMRNSGGQKVQHPDYIEAATKRYYSCIRRGKVWEDTYPLRGKDGGYRWFLSRAVPVRDKKGHIVHWFGTNTDIEDVRRRKELEYETAQLVEINHAKDEFIALASHQLRTPATGVKQYLGMLAQGYFGELEEAQQKMLTVAYNRNERQLEIINALLNVAQLDAGKVALQRKDCRLDTLLQAITKDHAEAFRNRQQTIKLHTPHTAISANIDSRLIRMVLENIIDNASKYSPNGKHVDVRLTQTDAPDQSGNSITITVHDQGVGIRKRDQAKLFQKFSRIDNELSMSASGSGLGLYWAKKIIDLHGGDIAVTSKAKQGSTFTIVLPRKPV